MRLELIGLPDENAPYKQQTHIRDAIKFISCGIYGPSHELQYKAWLIIIGLSLKLAYDYVLI